VKHKKIKNILPSLDFWIYLGCIITLKQSLITHLNSLYFVSKSSLEFLQFKLPGKTCENIVKRCYWRNGV